MGYSNTVEFSSIIDEIIKSNKDLSQKGYKTISQSRLSRIEANYADPKKEEIEILSKVFNCSQGVLRTEIQEHKKVYEATIKKMGDK